jgi:hypothetical protein
MPFSDYLKIRIDDAPYAHLNHYFDMVADKILAIKERGGKTLGMFKISWLTSMQVNNMI